MSARIQMREENVDEEQGAGESFGIFAAATGVMGIITILWFVFYVMNFVTFAKCVKGFFAKTPSLPALQLIVNTVIETALYMFLGPFYHWFNSCRK